MPVLCHNAGATKHWEQWFRSCSRVSTASWRWWLCTPRFLSPHHHIYGEVRMGRWGRSCCVVLCCVVLCCVVSCCMCWVSITYLTYPYPGGITSPLGCPVLFAAFGNECIPFCRNCTHLDSFFFLAPTHPSFVEPQQVLPLSSRSVGSHLWAFATSFDFLASSRRRWFCAPRFLSSKYHTYGEVRVGCWGVCMHAYRYIIHTYLAACLARSFNTLRWSTRRCSSKRCTCDLNFCTAAASSLLRVRSDVNCPCTPRFSLFWSSILLCCVVLCCVVLCCVVLCPSPTFWIDYPSLVEL